MQNWNWLSLSPPSNVTTQQPGCHRDLKLPTGKSDISDLLFWHIIVSVKKYKDHKLSSYVYIVFIVYVGRSVSRQIDRQIKKNTTFEVCILWNILQ